MGEGEDQPLQPEQSNIEPVTIEPKEAVFRSNLAELPAIRALLRSFCESLPGPKLSPQVISHLLLATNEAASNIIRHAHRSREGESLWFVLGAEEQQITIQIRYRGDPFDPSKVPPPAFDGSREGGFGVYMISRCMDEVHYIHEGAGWNLVRLVKARRGRRARDRAGVNDPTATSRTTAMVNSSPSKVEPLC